MRFLVFLVCIAMYCGTAMNVSSEEDEELFPGQKNLSVLLEATGGFEGAIFLDDYPEPESFHEEEMLNILAQSIPKEHILTYEGVEGSVREGVSREYSLIEYHRERVLELEGVLKENSVWVIHAPHLNHHSMSSAKIRGMVLSILQNCDALIVYAAGNVRQAPLDMYQSDSPYWENKPTTVYYMEEGILKEDQLSGYQGVKEFFRGGHAIMATNAAKKPPTFEEFTRWTRGWYEYVKMDTKHLEKIYQTSGEYVRHPMSIRFGDLKEYGFTVLLQDGNEFYGTSDASAHLAAFAFYLRQLWGTTAEVLEVMRKTAIDAGEPGVDEEFGWGIINANHPIIWDRAMEKLEESLQFCLLEDVTFEQVLSVAGQGFDMLHRIENNRKELGFVVTKDKTGVALVAGSTARPFGLNSKFLRQQIATAQIGIRHAVTESLSGIGVYGHGTHEDAVVRKGSVGIEYQKHFSDDRGGFALYAGYRTVWGSFGIPGYKTVGVAQTPFTLRMVEARASFTRLF